MQFTNDCIGCFFDQRKLITQFVKCIDLIKPDVVNLGYLLKQDDFDPIKTSRIINNFHNKF